MKKLIVWEKWADPFEEKNQIDQSHDEEEDYDKPSYEQINPIKLIMGSIPTNQININDSQSFNFWLAHTNFNITNDIGSLIEKTDGVEVLDILTRYRFRVGIGKIFTDREVMKSINDNIYEYINDND
jgi:hypothetical protein